MIVVPYKPEHMMRLALQDAQGYMRRYITPEYAEALASQPSFTGLDGDVVVGCSGIIPVWENRAVAWAILSPTAGKWMLQVTKAVRNFLDNCGFRRVEISVDCGFTNGHRWAKTLGFEAEQPEGYVMRAYRPDGGDCVLYSRVRA